MGSPAYKRQQVALGNCGDCGRERDEQGTSVLCGSCAGKKRERARRERFERSRDVDVTRNTTTRMQGAVQAGEVILAAILAAFKGGARTWDDFMRVTELTDDELSDGLALLWDAGRIRARAGVAREYRLVA